MKSHNPVSHTLLLLFAIGCILLFGRCSKDTTYIILEDDVPADSLLIGTVDSLAIIPQFTCGIRSVKTYSFSNNYKEPDSVLTPIPKNSFVHLYVYAGDSVPGETPWSYFCVYYASRKGILSPQYNYIQLSPGTYTFYAIATNDVTQDITPNIQPSTGLSQYLYNDEAYYWWCSGAVKLSEENTQPTFGIVFDQLSATLEMVFTAPDSTWKLNGVNFNVPNSREAHLSLRTGLINPVHTWDEIPEGTSVPSDTLHYMIPPFGPNSPMQINVAYEKDNRLITFQKDLPLPKNKLYQGGYIYNYLIDLETQIVKTPY